ncbi:hypothetical protein [Mycolicibacterium fortuitum]|uniref:hypothetical protein n=1 Tax=Mycolicibacterium fortuitum TaxID=1766 RepID=UPI002632C378|nr:hypothetical protein [Mycolicibacterium fortuitum]
MTTVLQEPGPGTVMIAGDWHGNTGWATALIISAGVRGIKVVVQLGDFGFWTPGRRSDDYLDGIETACARHGVTVLWLDGNHECFDALYELPIDPETGLRQIRPHIFHLPRGLRWRWHGKTWMALGGAHSVDRPDRKPGRELVAPGTAHTRGSGSGDRRRTGRRDRRARRPRPIRNPRPPRRIPAS